MKLKEYLKEINKLVEKNPDLLEREIVYSKDDESNGYQKVLYTPTTGTMHDNEFYEDSDDDEKVICIN